MRNRRSIWFLIPLLLAATASHAAPAALARAERPDPTFVIRGLDHEPVIFQNPVTGETWSGWAYRSGSEFDLALSRLDDSGRWSDPELIGTLDGTDQMHPAFAADPRGNLYVVFDTGRSGGIFMTIRPAGTDLWSPALPVTPWGVGATHPSVRIVADRLVLAYRTPTGTDILEMELPLLGGGIRGDGVQDGPDGFPPNGRRPDQPVVEPGGGLVR